MRSFGRLLWHACLLGAFVAAGLWLGANGHSLYQRWWVGAPPAIADNSAYFRGESAPVLLFGTATCPWCARTRELLAQLHVPYREHRIDASAEAMQLYRSLNAPGVPVVLVGDRRFYGYDEVAIRAAVAPLVQGAGGARNGSARQRL